MVTITQMSTSTTHQVNLRVADAPLATALYHRNGDFRPVDVVLAFRTSDDSDGVWELATATIRGPKIRTDGTDSLVYADATFYGGGRGLDRVAPDWLRELVDGHDPGRVVESHNYLFTYRGDIDAEAATINERERQLHDGQVATVISVDSDGRAHGVETSDGATFTAYRSELVARRPLLDGIR